MLLDPVFEAQVQQVFQITQRPLNHIRSDLRFTKNVELTIDRAFDGSFLKGTDRDPERKAALWEGSSPAGKEREGGYVTSGDGMVERDKANVRSVVVVSDSDQRVGTKNDKATSVAQQQAKRPAHTVGSLREKIFSSPRAEPLGSHFPQETSNRQTLPPPLPLTAMDNDPIMFTSSAAQQEQLKTTKRKRPALMVVEISDDDDDVVPVLVPKRKESKKPRRGSSLAADQDLDNIEVFDLSQPERQKTPLVTQRSVAANTPAMLPEPFSLSMPDTVANGGGFLRDDIDTFELSSPPKATTAVKPISMDNGDFDDSLWNDNLWKNFESPEPIPKSKTMPIPIDLSSDDDVEAPLLPAPKAKAKPKAAFSATTLALLAQLSSDSDPDDSEVSTLDDNPRPTKPKKAPKASATKKPLPTSRSSITETAVPKRGRLSEEEKARRAAEKAAAVEARKAAKEAAAAEKKRQAELDSANKLRTSKKDSIPEMIVDISTALAGDAVGQQLIGFLTKLGCSVNPAWRPAVGIESSWKVVKWRRKVKATYDEAAGMFIPLPAEEVRDEKHVLVHLTAAEFADLASPPDALDQHVQKMKHLVAAAGPNVRVIYMVEGLSTYTRKAKTHEDRTFRTQVLSAMSGSSTTSRRTQSLVPEETLETLLLRLQLSHTCLIHHTSSAVQSAEWITILTSDISTIPYKTARMVLNTSFCTDVGQVKTGADREDTWAKMLQEIHRVTPAVANGIVEGYPDVRSLVRAFEEGGEDVLRDVLLLSNRNGAPSNRTVGAAVSARIAGVFLGRDPEGMEV